MISFLRIAALTGIVMLSFAAGQWLAPEPPVLVTPLPVRAAPAVPETAWGQVFDLSRKVQVDMNGFVMYAMADDYVGKTIIETKEWEPHITALIRRELKAGDTFMDLGANLGFYSMLASSIVGPRGKVIAFEPHPQNLQLIYESQLANGYRNQMVYPYAVSDKAGILKFATVGSNGGVVTEKNATQKHYLLVPAVTLDGFLPDQKISMIKIDIEAHEPSAVAGMTRLIQKRRPKIITEFHPWIMNINNHEKPEAYLAQLESLGYQLSVIHKDGMVEKMRRDEIMAYWSRLSAAEPTIHIDLYCVPK